MLRLHLDWRNSKGNLYESQNRGKESGRAIGILEESIPFLWNTVGRCSLHSTVHLNGSWPIYTVVCRFCLIDHLSRLGGRLAQIMAKQQVTDYLSFSVYYNIYFV